jgi:hypothetical protein
VIHLWACVKQLNSDEDARYELNDFLGVKANLVDLRTHAMKEGRLVPTPKGLAMVVRRLPELVDALTKALAKAKELGLIDEDAKADA